MPKRKVKRVTSGEVSTTHDIYPLCDGMSKTFLPFIKILTGHPTWVAKVFGICQKVKVFVAKLLVDLFRNGLRMVVASFDRRLAEAWDCYVENYAGSAVVSINV